MKNFVKKTFSPFFNQINVVALRWRDGGGVCGGVCGGGGGRHGWWRCLLCAVKGYGWMDGWDGMGYG